MHLLDEIERTANQSNEGGYVDTDGEWCTTQTSEDFRAFLQNKGLHVKSCGATPYSTAVAELSEGYHIAWNGHCRKLETR